MWYQRIIHSYDISKANVHDIHYLYDIKHEYNRITIIGDKGYLSASVLLDLFETSRSTISVESKGLETNFSSLS